MKKIIAISVLMLSYFGVFAQKDTTKVQMLLSDLKVQMECTEAIDSLYNGNFIVAETQFGWLIQQYPDHPLGYFLMALSQRWKIMPNDEETKYDDKFYEYLEITIEKAKDLYKLDKKSPEASFFLAGAYGFKAQRLAENGKLVAAIAPAEHASDFIVKNLDLEETFGPEFVYGKGLYNYFREWIPMHKKVLKPVIATFRKGDMELGIEQLHEVASSAFYTRIEALVYLMDIYCEYGVYTKKEKKYEWYKAFEISKNLYRTYTQNKYFERRYAELCLKTGYDNEIGLAIVQRNLEFEKLNPGSLDKKTVRNFSYFFAKEMWSVGKESDAAFYYEQCSKLSLDMEIEKLDYSLTSFYHTGLHNKKIGNKAKAVEFFEYYVDNIDKSSFKYSKKDEKSKVENVKNSVDRKKAIEKKFNEAQEYIKQNKPKKFLGIF